jgi:hypothetical protein
MITSRDPARVGPQLTALVKARVLAIVGGILTVFAIVAALTQFFHGDPQFYGVPSLAQFAVQTRQLAAITNLLDFELKENPFDGACRKLELALPSNARIYMDDMLGATNLGRTLMYASVAYYLFPREVATSLDQPALITRDGYVGRAAEYMEELVTNRFDVEISARPDTLKSRPLRQDLEVHPPTSPEWFRSRTDTVIAFLLPLLTTLAGLWLVEALFSELYRRMGLFEKLACALGLGMMTISALTLSLKLCDFHGGGVVLLLTGVGAMLTCWKNRKIDAAGVVNGIRELASNPAAWVALLFFFVVFSAAGILGLVESDAVAAWMLKAKILHLYSGHEVVRWFSEPRLAHAHMDYPLLVPALHAATFDSLGHVDEYVTKFWPAWMLVFLAGGLASVNRRGGKISLAVSFFLVAVLLLPATRQYVEMEGSTMPMVFFTVQGLLQCALGQVEQDRSRTWLGLTLLFGAAMTKFEGWLTLGAAVTWLAVVPSARFALKFPTGLARLAAFWMLTLLPFVALRLQIPALHYESAWPRYTFLHPLNTLSNLPAFLMMMTARWFVSPAFADWSADRRGLHWTGHWEGLASLYNHPTLGLGWLALGLTLACWYMIGERRGIIVWLTGVILTLLIAFSAVFSGFVTTMDRTRALEYYTAEIASGRYLFPLLIAWSAIMVTLLYQEKPALETAPANAPPDAQLEATSL